MVLSEIKVKQSYSSDVDDILNEFYIPALGAAKRYRRLAGFFSSTSLAVAARGVLGLVRNGGKVELIASPRLSKSDLDVLGRDFSAGMDLVTKRLLLEIDYSKLENKFVRDHVFALAWMLKNGLLDIRVAILEDEIDGIFHEKVGILEDSAGNILTFSGSVNESAAGWLGNIEEFKVFRSWESGEKGYVESDVAKFSRFWEGSSPRVQVIPVPLAVKRRLCSLVPDDFRGVDTQAYEESSRARYRLFPYQTEAVGAWLRNDMRGIFEMATGTGKTFTALACLAEARKRYDGLITVISCPYQHLVHQWQGQIERFGMKPNVMIADSSRPWRDAFADQLIDVALGRETNLLVLTTHMTAASKDFLSILSDKLPRNSKIFLIADEVHAAGAPKLRTGLAEPYSLRLGLSATPQRWFDSEGSDLIKDYFGGTVFEFPLKRAISEINPLTGFTFLTPYCYIPVFVTLDQAETRDYLEKTRRIHASWGPAKNDPEQEAALEALMFARANIVKNAAAKVTRLKEILRDLGDGIRSTIIYCTPQQIDQVMEIIRERRIAAHRFTMDEGTVSESKYGGVSERDFILSKFGEGLYRVLVAMKCLDEGVDVPQAHTAILLASSTNPREYIQRIGRVIRHYPGKTEARIYDFIVVPSFESMPPEIRRAEISIFDREMRRVQEIVDLSVNRTEALKQVFDLVMKVKGEVK